MEIKIIDLMNKLQFLIFLIQLTSFSVTKFFEICSKDARNEDAKKVLLHTKNS